MLVGGRSRVGPPILLTQTEQTAYAPEGTDRLGGAVQPGATKPILIGALNLLGPPILVQAQTAQTIFLPEGSDRFLGPPPPSPKLMLLGMRPRAGPPILVTQQAVGNFPAEGNDRFIDTPITHPLLKFRIGRRSPPIVQATQVELALAGSSGSSFPVQYFGFKIKKTGSIIELCLVAEADAPSGMGGVLKIRKGGVNYVLYLVETTDPNASPLRIKTSTGIKAIRLKT